MSNTLQTDVIIVGSGPAGLSLAYCLQKLSLDYLVVEKNQIGHSWENMPKYWRVVSPQWTNTLPGTGFPFKSPFSKPIVNKYKNYLLKYSVDNSINVLDGINVQTAKVNNNSSGFLLISNEKRLECKILVSATGYFSNPYIPELPGGNDESIKSIHVSEYYSPEDLKVKFPHCKNILIVGRRVSAGQLLTDLYEYGFSISISARGPICPRDGSIKGKIKDFIYFPYEEVKIKFYPRLYADSFPGMDGGQTERLLNKELVTIRSNIMGIKHKNVIFDDGCKENYDLVIFATGYKPTLNYLQNIIALNKSTGLPNTADMQSLEAPNLFFIGLDQVYNFRSRYLRGIRRDVKILSNKISTILKNMSL